MLIIGHRGAAGHAPENTLRSFARALELGVHGIEVDAQLTKDQFLVALHDERLDRTTDGSGVVWQHPLHHVQRLNAGEGEQIPLISEVLDLIGARVLVNVELKSPAAVRPAVELIQDFVARNDWNYEHFLLTSFEFSATRETSRLDPQIPLGLLVEGPPPNQLWDTARDQRARYVNVGLGSVTKPLVDEAHQRGLRILVFTINTAAEAREMRQLSVDGIFTDYPDRVGAEFVKTFSGFFRDKCV